MIDLKLLGSLSGEYYGDNNDVTIDSDGDIVATEGKDRTMQGTSKIVLTELGSHLIDSEYGTRLYELISKKVNTGEIQSEIADTVISALSYLADTEESTVPEEQLDEIKSIKIRQEENSQKIFIDLVATLASGEELLITIGV